MSSRAERPPVQRRILVGCTVVAVVATLGSLYFSEVMNLIPCELCWYQRILMYPLVVVLAVAAYENRTGVWKSGLPLSTLGIAVAAHHVRLQVAPSGGVVCTTGCGGVDWEYAFLTIPRLSLIAFVLVTAGLGVVAYLDWQSLGEAST
jgi:disulfide bond formation protein DsbB